MYQDFQSGQNDFANKKIPCDITSLENMSFFFKMSPYYRKEPICAMLVGGAFIRRKEELEDVKLNAFINKNDYFQCCIGFAKTHICLVFYIFDKEIGQNILTSILWMPTNQFKHEKVLLLIVKISYLLFSKIAIPIIIKKNY